MSEKCPNCGRIMRDPLGEFGECTGDAMCRIAELQAEIERLKESLRMMIGYAENPVEPPPPGHTCGPEGNCDCLCMAWGHYQQHLVDARKALQAAESAKEKSDV